MKSAYPRVLIIGGGFGGLEAAKALKGAEVRITLLDRSNHHLFQPLLYQVAMAGLSPADIAVPIRSILHAQENAMVLLGEAVGIDLERKRVELNDGETLAYDYVVIATGAKTNFFGHDEWTRHSLGLKTIDDALAIRSRVLLAFEAAEREKDDDARRRLMTFVVIGGGPTGVECAGALSELSRFVLADDYRVIHPDTPKIILVEAQDRLLPGGFTDAMAKSAKRQLEELNVEVRLGTRVERIDDTGVILDEGRIESTTVLWTAGVRARSMTEKLGVELDRAHRVVVEQDCSIAGHPEAFVIGDCACFVPEGEERPLPGVSPVAMQMGRHVAANIVRSMKEKKRLPFSYVDKGIMATIGRSRAVAQSGWFKLSGFIAWLAWLAVHIWYLIGFRNRLIVMLNWAWNYIIYKRGARLITGAQWIKMLEISRQAERIGHNVDPPAPSKPEDADDDSADQSAGAP